MIHMRDALDLGDGQARGARDLYFAHVRRLLEQKQPGFAASLEFAVSLADTSMEKPMTMN